MNTQDIILLIFGAGGTGALAGIWQIIQALKRGKLDKEETLIKRLDEYSKVAEDRAREAEQRAAKYRRQRIRAQDQAAKFRRLLISHSNLEESNLEQLEEYDD